MFNFTPFNWASSVILSKFLKPYFKELDDKQVDVGFWNGEFTLRNLELRREVFLMNDLNLEVVHSLISQLKIKIPWKSIKTEPIQIEIQGLKLIVSNKLDQTEEEKEEVKKKMHQMKMDALDQFESSYEKYNKEQQKNENKKEKKDGKSSSSFYTNWIQNISQNFKLKIENIELVYIYHVTKYEVLKIGLNIDSFEIGTVDESFQQKNSFNSILKNLSLKNISFYLEFYDSFLSTQIQTKNFFDVQSKRIGFFSKHKTPKGQEQNHMLNQHKESDENENYILKQLNVEILIKLDVFYKFQLEMNINIPDITIFLKQNQMRLLLKSLKDLANYDSKRPIYRPNEKLPEEEDNLKTLSPVKQWWQYAIERVMAQENLLLKSKQKGFLGFFDSFKYRKIYTKRKIQIKLKESEVRFFEQFELNYPLSQLIILRQIAINTLVLNKNSLLSDVFQEKNDAEKWFKNLGNVPISKIQNLNYYFIQEENFQKTYKTEEDAGNNAQPQQQQQQQQQQEQEQEGDQSTDSQSEKKDNSLPIIAEVQIGHFEILIEENSMLSDVKNLHHQANLFKESLSTKPHLQQQVLRHIKKNFISELSKRGINESVHKEKINNSADELNHGGTFEWNHANIFKKRKILLCMQFDGIMVIFNKQDNFISQTQCHIKGIHCLDMHNKNQLYNKVLAIDQGLQFMLKQEIVKVQKVALKNATEEKIIHNNIDMNVPSVSLTLCKPFIERCSILMQVIFFDPDKSSEKTQTKADTSKDDRQKDYNFEKQQQFYTQFLQQKDKVNTFTNMAVNVAKLNINLPLNYEVLDKLLVIQLKNCKLFKREHESLLEENLKMRNNRDEFKTEGDILEPLLVTVHCLKILIAQDHEWENNQNIFLHNLKKVQNKEAAGNEKTYYKKTVEEDTQIILETLPLSVRMERIYSNYTIGQICVFSQEKRVDLKKNITPLQQRLHVNLPFFLINVSVNQLQTILYLAQVWSLKGYDLHSALQDQGSELNEQPLKGGVPSLQNISQEQTGQTHGSSLIMGNQPQQMKSLFGRQNSQERKIKQIIERNILYDERIMQFLLEHVFFQMDLQIEGIQLNLNLCAKEVSKKYEGKLYHSNELISLNLLNLQVQTRSFYFTSSQQINIETLYIQNKNCCNYDLLTNLKHQCTHNLSRSDYQVVLQDTCPLKQDVSQFQSIIYKNRKTAEKFYKQKVKSQAKRSGLQNGLNKQKNKKEQELNLSFEELESLIHELENNQNKKQNGGFRNQKNGAQNIDGVIIESDNEDSQKSDSEDEDEFENNDEYVVDEKNNKTIKNFLNEGENIELIAGERENKKKKQKNAESLTAREGEEKLLKSLQYFEEEYLLLNLKDQSKLMSSKTNGDQQLNLCQDCYGPNSQKKFAILNFQSRDTSQYDEYNPFKDKEHSRTSTPPQPQQGFQKRVFKKGFSRIEELIVPSNESISSSSSSAKNDQTLSQFEDDSVLQNESVKDIIITIDSIDNEYFVAKEDTYHDAIPSLINIDLNLPVLTLDPLSLAQIKSIFDISGAYVQERIYDFKEYMQSKGFSPYIDEEKEEKIEVNKGDQYEQNSETDSNSDTKINSKINSQMTLAAPTITIVMMHNVPQKDRSIKILEPTMLLYLADFILIQQSTQAYNLMTITSCDVCLYDISEKTGSFQPINNQKSEFPYNQLSIEMKTFHSKALSQLQNFSSYIGIKLQEAKIVFLKRNTMEIQVYIRMFLLDALKNRVQPEDIKFMREYSKKLVLDKYDLFSNEKEVLHEHQEQNQPVQQQPEPSDMKMEIVVLNSIVNAYRSSLSEKDGLFVHFTKLGYWFTGKWGQDFLKDGLIDKGFHQYEIDPNGSAAQQNDQRMQNSFQECLNATQSSLQQISQNGIQEFNSPMNTQTNDLSVEDDDQFYDVQSEQDNNFTVNQRMTFQYNPNHNYSPVKNPFMTKSPSEVAPTYSMGSNDFKQVKSQMHVSNASLKSSIVNSQFVESIKPEKEKEKVIEIQRIFMWDFKVYASEEYQNKDITILSPPDVPSVEVKIIFDDPDFSLYTGITDVKVLPMKISVFIPELSLYLYDKDYCTICKLFQENIPEAPRTVFLDQIFDIYNNNIWQFLDINVQKVNAKLFQGERKDLLEMITRDYNYQHSDNNIDNDIPDHKFQNKQADKESTIYRKPQFDKLGGIQIIHSRNNSTEKSNRNKNPNPSKRNSEPEESSTNREQHINNRHDYFVQQISESQVVKKGNPQRKYKNVFLISNPASLTEMVLENVVYHFYMHENGCKVMKVWSTKLDINDFRMCSKLQNRMVMFDIKDWQKVDETAEEFNNQYSNQQTTAANQQQTSNKPNPDLINFLDNNENEDIDDNDSLDSDDLNVNEDFDVKYAKKQGDDIIAEDEREQQEDDILPQKKNVNLDEVIQTNNNIISSSPNNNFKKSEDSFLSDRQKKEFKDIEQKLKRKQEKMMKKNLKKKMRGENAYKVDEKQEQQNNNNNNQLDKHKLDTQHNFEEEDEILEERRKRSLSDKFVDVQIQDGSKNREQNLTFWQKVGNFFCCRRKKNQQSKEKDQQNTDLKEIIHEKPKEMLQTEASKPSEVQLIRQLENWPQDDFPRGRKWIIKRYKQSLAMTLPDTSSQRLYQYEDMEEQYRHFKFENLYHFVGKEENLEYNDLKFAFVTQPDGEKIIKIHIKNKNFVFMNDYLFDMIGFFRTPFNGSDDILGKQFFRSPKYNNYPPMVIKIYAENFWALILDELSEPKNCLAVNLNADYLQEWVGDCGMGPGSALMDINVDLRKILTCSTDRIYQDVGQHFKTYSFTTIKLIQKYLNDQQNQVEQTGSYDNQSPDDKEKKPKENEQGEGKSPKKKLKFFSKQPINLKSAPFLIKEDSQELQKEIQKVELNTNLIIPFKIRFKNSYIIDYYKLNKEHEEEQLKYQENILPQVLEGDNNSTMSDKYQYSSTQTPYTHQQIEINIFNKKQKKFRNFNVSMYSLKQLSTITAKMMNSSTYITLFKQENPHPKNMAAFTEQIYLVKSISEENKNKYHEEDVIKNYVPKRLTNEEIQSFQNNPEERCISVLRVKLKRFKIETFKNYFGNQTLKLKISDLILKKISKGDNQSMGLKGNLKIKYYNKRKGFYEPFLEPWTFHVQNQKVDSDSNLHVGNFEDEVNLSNTAYKELESVLNHRNSLNINLSTAFLETVMEAKNAFGQTNQQLRPYNIVNQLGYGLLFLLGENKKVYMEDLIQQLISKSEEKEYIPQNKGDKSEKGRMIKKIKNLMVNFIILKPTKELQIKDKVEQYLSSLAVDMQRMKASPIPTKSTIFNPKNSQIYSLSNAQNTTSSTFVIQDTLTMDKKQQSTHEMTNTTHKESKLKQKILISQNFSDFRTINRASLDKIGKQFFLLENLNSQQINVSNGERDKFIEKYKDMKNLLNQTNQDFFVVDVSLDSGDGRKQITIQSSVRVFNNLDKNIIICFLKKKEVQVAAQQEDPSQQPQQQQQQKAPPPPPVKKDQSDITDKRGIYGQLDKYRIQKQSSFAIPLNILQDKRDVFFYIDPQNDMDFMGNNKPKSNQDVIKKIIVPSSEVPSQFDKGQELIDKEISDKIIYKIDQFILPQSVYSDFDPVEKDIKLNDIIGKPCIEYENERFGRLIYKQNYEVDSNKIEKKDVSSQFKEVYNNIFQINIVKTKQPVQNILNKNSYFCYETSIILNPFLKIINATIEDIKIDVGDNPITLRPGEYHIPYNIDFKKAQRIRAYSEKNTFVEFNPFIKKSKDFVKMDPSPQSDQVYPIFMHLEYIKISKFSRIVTMYSPYIIYNRTGLDLFYKQENKDFIVKKSFFDNLEKKKNESKSSGSMEPKMYEESLQLFSPSNNFKKLSIGILPKNSQAINWSQNISMSTKAHVGIQLTSQSEGNTLFEVNLNISQGKGELFRTEIITITPKYYFFNQTEYDLIVTQKNQSVLDPKTQFQLLKGQIQSFYWPQKDLNQIIYLSFKQEENNPKFSNPFKIDEINNFAVKVPFRDINNKNIDDEKKKKKNENTVRYKYKFITISINQMNGVFCVRFQDKGQPPPYIILNKTSHEIFVQQFIPEYVKTCCSKKRNTLTSEKKVIFPKQRIVFTWDHWNIDFDKQLSVEIDTNQKTYNLEKLKDYEPIYLQKKDDKITQKDTNPKKKILYKKGFLMICDNFKDQFDKYFCILNIFKQKLKLYINKEKITTIDLVYAKLELLREGFDIITVKQKRWNIKLCEDAGIRNNMYEWYISIYNSIQYNMPDKVDFKIEPRNGTMEITFYQQKKYFEMNKGGNMNRKGILNFDEDGIPYQIHHNNYELNIKNMIGISIIDDMTQELFSVSLKNVSVVFQEEQKWIKEDDEIETVQNPQTQIQTDNIEVVQSQKRQLIKHVTKSFLQFSLENIFINNQDISKSQYPVIFASDKKKTGQKPPPFIFISTQWKNVTNKFEEEGQQVDQVQQQLAEQDRSAILLSKKEGDVDNRSKNIEFKSDEQLYISKKSMVVSKNVQVQKLQTLSLDNEYIDENDNAQLLESDATAQQSVQWINNLQIYFDHFEIRIDSQIIQSIFTFIAQLNQALYQDNTIKLMSIQDILTEYKQSKIDQILIENINSGIENMKKAMYIKNLSIQPINFCLTLNLAGMGGAGDSALGQSLLTVPLAIFQEFGLELVAIDQASINLNALNQQHLYDYFPSIQSRIQKHYISQFLTEIYKIFGSFEAIGNPVKLVKNISSSVQKMIYNPLKSLYKGSGAQAVGDLATGAISLVSISISSFYKAARNISGFIMRVIAKITFHKQYLQDRSIRVNRQIKNIRDGFQIGFKNFLLILWDTVYGIIYLPLEGCRKNHIFGLARGCYTAFVSIFIKPTVGLYDFLISIFDGLVNSAIYEEHVMEYRSRPPRIFETSKITNFDYKNAIGKDILRRVKQIPKSYEAIKYYDEIQIAKNKFVEIVLTDIRLVCAQKNSSVDYKKVQLHKIKYIEYNARKKYFQFYYDVPVKNLLKCCSRDDTRTKVRYEKFDNQEKANTMIKSLQEHYKQQKIPIKIVILE